MLHPHPVFLPVLPECPDPNGDCVFAVHHLWGSSGHYEITGPLVIREDGLRRVTFPLKGRNNGIVVEPVYDLCASCFQFITDYFIYEDAI